MTKKSLAAHAAAQTDIELNNLVGEIAPAPAPKSQAKPAKQGKPAQLSGFKANLHRWQALKEQKGKLGFCIKQVLNAKDELKLSNKELTILKAWRTNDKPLRSLIKPNAKSGNFNAYQVFMQAAKQAAK